MEKIKKVLFNVDVFRCVFIFLMMFALIYKINNIVGPFVKFIILPWGYFLLLRDLLGKRVLFTSKYIWILIAFLGLYAVTILLNRTYLIENIKIYVYMVLFLLLLYPSDMSVTLKSKCRAVFIFNGIFILPVTVMSAASLWAQITSFGLRVKDSPMKYMGYARNNRLTGFYLNPNTGGAVSFIAIALLIINWTLISRLSAKKSARIAWKITCSIMVILNMAMLTLTDSRAARYSLLVFVMIFSFFMFIRLFSKRMHASRTAIASVILAFLIAGAVYAVDRPIRVGTAIMQAEVDRIREVKIIPVSIKGTLAIAQLKLDVTAEIDEEARELDILAGRNNGFTEGGRIALWRLGFEVIRQKPFFGVSPAGIVDKALELNGLKAEEERLIGLEGKILNSGLHNLYIHLAATNGIPGFIMFMLFLLLFAVDSLKKLFIILPSRISPVTIGILALCVSLLFLNLLEVNVFLVIMYSSVIFWSNLGFAQFLLNSNWGMDNEKNAGA